MGSPVFWIVIGALCVLAGMLSLANPLPASFAASVLAGWGFLVTGILQAIAAFRAEEWEPRLWAMLLALAFVVTGIMLLGEPLAGIIPLTALIGILFLISGIARAIIGFSLPRGRAFRMVTISGALAILLSLMIFTNIPRSAATMLGDLLVVELMANGLAMIALGALRRDL